MSRNIAKANMKSFHKKVKQLLLEWGAIKQDDIQYRYILNAKAGELNISIHEDHDLEGTSLYSIFCRFEDVKKARNFLQVGKNDFFKDHRLNPHSGKYNFHFSDQLGILTVFEQCIEYLLIKKDLPITDYDKIKNLAGKFYEAPGKLIVHGETHEGRISIDNSKAYDWCGNSGMVVMCNGNDNYITKTTPFQLWKGKLMQW